MCAVVAFFFFFEPCRSTQSFFSHLLINSYAERNMLNVLANVKTFSCLFPTLGQICRGWIEWKKFFALMRNPLLRCVCLSHHWKYWNQVERNPRRGCRGAAAFVNRLIRKGSFIWLLSKLGIDLVPKSFASCFRRPAIERVTCESSAPIYRKRALDR